MKKFWKWKNRTVTNQETQTETVERTLFLNGTIAEPAAGTDSAATGSVPAPHPAPPRDRGRVVALQAALNGLGYGPLDLDGRMGEATAEAIRRFELDNGMPISGLVDDDLIATMIRIGAMKPH